MWVLTIDFGSRLEESAQLNAYHSVDANPKQSFVCAGVSTCSMCSAGSYADATGLMLWYRNIENRLSSSIRWVSDTICCCGHDVRYQFKRIRIQSSQDVKIIFVNPRHWPEVYDVFHSFLQIARVKKHTDMRESHAKCMQFSNVRVFLDSRHVRKRATKADTFGHCLVNPTPLLTIKHYTKLNNIFSKIAASCCS